MVMLTFDDHENEETRDKHDKKDPFGKMREEFLGRFPLFRFKVNPLTPHRLAGGTARLIFFIRHEIPGLPGSFIRCDAGLLYNRRGRMCPRQQAIVVRAAFRIRQDFV